MFSLLGQGVILLLVVYLTGWVIRDQPSIVEKGPSLADLPLVFSGHNGGGGGNFDKFPASRGNPPKATPEVQVVAPTVKLPSEMPKLPPEETVMVAPEVRLPQGGQIGDPSSPFSKWLSDGPGGPGGMGNGCCNGVGEFSGPHVGSGPPGIYPAGKHGVTVPEAIYNPEPSFSDEARKAKQQGLVTLLLVVGQDGKTYDIRVRKSLGMGLDEKAMEAVGRWRFKPATLNGQAVATQIEVEVEFHLY